MLNELIERLEKATGPDRELDAGIYRVFADPRWDHDLSEDRKMDYCAQMARAYTASLDAALTLVPEGWTRAVDATAPECLIDVELFAPGAGPIAKGSHKSESIATCIAALKARSAQSS